MKNINLIWISLLFFVIQISITASQSLSGKPEDKSPVQFLDLYGPYFGQELPGSEPIVFADGIISGKTLHATPSFSPDGTEIYWAEQGDGPGLSRSSVRSEHWLKPFAGRGR